MTMRMNKIPLAILLLTTTMTVSAEDADLTKMYHSCMDKANSTLDITFCTKDELKRQDVRLNKAYKDAGADYSASRKKQLQDAQRLWIKYRDANCDFCADPEGGTYARVLAGNCMVSMTAKRAKELEDVNKP
jgi:uncharacterized protein YecT (DUF1311 family)